MKTRNLLIISTALIFCSYSLLRKSPVEVADTAVMLNYTVYGINSYRVCGVLKNTSDKTLVFPVLKVSLPSVANSLMHTVTGCIVPAGESRYFLTGGEGIDSFVPPIEISYLYSDNRIEKAYVARQLKYLPKLSCTDVYFDSSDTGRGGSLRYRFVNNSDLRIGSIQATAVFFDEEGTLIAAWAFHSTKLDNPEGKHYVMDIENGQRVVRAEIQIDTFIEEGDMPNQRVAVPPSVE
ncbi:hypothetical protein RAHE111665_00060 [Rariglobus hedericola]